MNLSLLTNLIKALNKAKFKVIFILFLVFILHTFKNEVEIWINARILKKDRVVSNLDNDVLINNSLYDLMDYMSADRAYIFLFHNGVTYYSGTHKNKMSCDYEVVRNGISSEAIKLQDIPVTLVSSYISDVVSYKMIHSDIDNIKDERTRQALKVQGIKGLICLPYYRNGNLIAIIGVDYVKEIPNITYKPSTKELDLLKDRFFRTTNLLL
jgi:hypothetical protein